MLEAVKKIKMPSMEENGLGVENKEEKMVCGQSGNRFFKKKEICQVTSEPGPSITQLG